MFRHGGGNLLERQEGVDPEQALHVPVVGVEPELEELVGAGPRRVEPDVARFTLAELAAGGSGEGRRDQAVDLALLPPPDELDSGRDVAPRIAPADLQLAILVPEQL